MIEVDSIDEILKDNRFNSINDELKRHGFEKVTLNLSQIDDDEYTTRKILTILGDGDKADEVLERRAANEMNRISIPIVDDGEDNEPDEPDV